MLNKTKRLITSFVVAALIPAGSFGILYLILSAIDGHSIYLVNDCLFACGAFELLVIFLIYIVRTGIFDAMGFSIRTFFHYVFNARNERKYENFEQYKASKDEKRLLNKNVYWPYLAVAAALVVISIIITISLYASGAYENVVL